jgi:hypothetical protein
MFEVRAPRAGSSRQIADAPAPAPLASRGLGTASTKVYPSQTTSIYDQVSLPNITKVIDILVGGAICL